MQQIETAPVVSQNNNAVTFNIFNFAICWSMTMTSDYVHHLTGGDPPVIQEPLG